MANEVLIIVKADVRTKTAYDQALRDAKVAGDRAGTAYTDSFGQRVGKLATTISGTVRQAGQKIGEDLGGKTGEQVERKVSESVRRTRTSAKPAAEMAGQGIGQDIGDALTEPIAAKVKGALYVSRSRSQGAARDTGRGVGQDIGDALTEPIVNRVRGAVYVSASRSMGAARSSGDAIGAEMGDRAGSTLAERIRSSLRRKFRGGSVDVDVDTKGGATGIAGDVAKEGADSGRAFGTSFLSGVSGFFNSSVVGQVFGAIGITIGAALGAAVASTAAAAIISGVLGALGGGVLLAGIMGALKDPMFSGNDPKHPFKTGAIADLKKQFSDLLTEFGKPFRSPLANFLEKLSHFLDVLAPKFAEVAREFAPIADQLGTGLIALLQNAMPGILEALGASEPILETLAKHMPEIGDAISRFFSIIADQGDDANLFFNDLLNLIELLIPLIGGLIAVFASAYDGVHRFAVLTRDAFRNMGRWVSNFATTAEEYLLKFALFVMDRVFAPILIAASEAFGWIPGLQPKLKAAEDAFNRTRKKINSELDKIHNKTVNIRIRQIFETIGSVATGVADVIRSQMATGGIKGAANGATSGGWTWVGERGPELAKLPPGTMVRTAGDSARMAGGEARGPLVLTADIDPSLESTVIAALFRAFRFTIRNQGGNVQRALGTVY